MIALLLVVVLPLQERLDRAREAEAQGDARDRAFLQLARCQEIAEPSVLRLEQVRARRFTPSERAQTVWRELDSLVFRANAPEGAVLWPRERERWPGEAPYLAEEKRACQDARPQTLAEEAALADRLLAVASTPELALHRAILAHRLGQPIPRLVPLDTPVKRLLDAERVFFDAAATKDEVVRALETYASLDVFEHDSRRVREIELALRTGDDALITRALRDDVQGEVGAYALAWRLLRSADVLSDARRAWPRLLKSSLNRALIDDVVKDALVRQPFGEATVATLKELYGAGGIERQVYKLATLAISRGQMDFARAALLSITTGAAANGKRTQAQAQQKLGIVAMMLGDAAMLVGAARAVPDLPAAVEEWLLVARTSPLAKPQTLQALVPLVKGPLQTELKELKVPKVLNISLSTGVTATPEAPPVEFAFPEVYSLL